MIKRLLQEEERISNSPKIDKISATAAAKSTVAGSSGEMKQLQSESIASGAGNELPRKEAEVVTLKTAGAFGNGMGDGFTNHLGMSGYPMSFWQNAMSVPAMPAACSEVSSHTVG